jgi:hypothetical protein
LEAAVRDWGQTLIRSFGIANWFYGLTGAYFLVDGLRRVHHSGFLGHSGRFPYEAKQYDFLVTINAIFIFSILIIGYWLFLIRKRGVVFSNYLFSIEILFWVLNAMVSLKLGMSGNAVTAAFGMSLGAVQGIGNMGTNLQFVTAYPAIALVALNLASRHLDRKGLWKVPQA